MKLKTIASIITFSIIATTMTQASIQNKITEVGSNSYCDAPVTSTYPSMTIAELQIEVEKHSNKDCLPFSLGKELIKRWTKS